MYPEEVIAQFKASLNKKEKEREKQREKEKEKEREKEKEAKQANGRFILLFLLNLLYTEGMLIKSKSTNN